MKLVIIIIAKKNLIFSKNDITLNENYPLHKNQNLISQEYYKIDASSSHMKLFSENFINEVSDNLNDNNSKHTMIVINPIENTSSNNESSSIQEEITKSISINSNSNKNNNFINKLQEEKLNEIYDSLKIILSKLIDSVDENKELTNDQITMVKNLIKEHNLLFNENDIVS